MDRKKTKLMIEDNTIYEIDLECLRLKDERENKKKFQMERSLKRGQHKGDKNGGC
ncbi:MAG: hypothetical protein ACOYBL_11420 [Lachnospiraceae bacterium]|jgi:hypothetical protein